MPAVMNPEVVPPAPAEAPTVAVAAAPQWSAPNPQGRGCDFCPRESSALLVHTVPLLHELIGRVLEVRLPEAEQPSTLAICADCMRVIYDAERTSSLCRAMCSHFESTQGASFNENLGRSGRKTQRLPSSVMAMTRSGAGAASFYSVTAATAAADDQQSQASSCDGCGSSTSGGGRGGGEGSGGHSCASASREQLDSTAQQQQQAVLASQCVVVPKVVRKRYFCTQCEKSFTAKSHYDDHVNKHSAAKKFVCALCGKAFKFKRGLREHARDAHARDVHSRGSLAEPLYPVLDGEDLLAYSAGDRFAVGGSCEAAAHSGAGVEPKLVSSIKVEPAGSGGCNDDDHYDNDECEDFDNECDDLAPTRPVSSALGRGSTSSSSSSGGRGHQESASRLPPPIGASHVASGEWQQECQPSSSASAIVFKRRGDSGCTSPEQKPMAVGARPPAGLDNGYYVEEEDDDDEGEDDDDNMRMCSSSESGNENTAGHARLQRRPSPLREKWQTSGRLLPAAARPPATVGRIVRSAALLPSTSCQQQQQRQRRKPLSPQQLPPPDTVQLVVFNGEAGREALPPAAGDGAVTFPCVLCQSRFKYKRGLVSHVKRKHRDPVEDPDERQHAIEFLQLLKDQRLSTSRKRTGSFGACSTSGSLAAATRAGVAVLEESVFAAVGDSVGSIGASDFGDDDDCDGRSATGAWYQRTSSGALLTVVDSAGSVGASDFGDDVHGNEENDLFDGRGAATSTEATPARCASAAVPAVAVAGSSDVRGRGSGGGRGSPTQPHWVAELRQNAPKFRPLAASTGRRPVAGSRDNGAKAGCPTPSDRCSGNIEYKGTPGAVVSSSAGAVKSVNDGDPVSPQPGGKRRRLYEDQSALRA